jgi:hypothetical protein
VGALRPGGVLFLNQTPYRWDLREHHTTALPFTNCMPDWLALRYARRFAGWKRHRVARDAEWETLLRGGIRGTTEGQIVRLLAATGRELRSLYGRGCGVTPTRSTSGMRSR